MFVRFECPNLMMLSSLSRATHLSIRSLLLAVRSISIVFCFKLLVSAAVDNPNGMIDLIVAPDEKFEGRIFLINDWDGGDADNQLVGEELNRDSRIKQGITILSDLPNRDPRKVFVEDLVKEATVLADASRAGKVGLAMGAHSRHVLAWLTELPRSSYNFRNIVLVTHSNWNELDGRKGYDANKKPGDPDLLDTHGEDLRRGLYASLAKISDLGVTIYEIPRTDFGPGGWGAKVKRSDGETATVKPFDISDLGLIHYLKTGVVEATREQRNAWVSDIMAKPRSLSQVDGRLVTRFWEKNENVPGEKKDYYQEERDYSNYRKGKLLYKDDFDREEIAPWVARKNVSIEKGVLKFTHSEGHGTVTQLNSKNDPDYVHTPGLTTNAFPSNFTDCIIELDFNLLTSTFSKVTFNDQYAGEYIHAGHVSRVLLMNKSVSVVDDASGWYGLSRAIRVIDADETLSDSEKKAEKTRVEAEWYPDYKSKAVKHPMTLEKGKWYRLKVVHTGSLLEAFIDGGLVASINSPGRYEGYLPQKESGDEPQDRSFPQPRGIDHYRSSWGFTVNNGEFAVDNVKVWEVLPAN